MFLYLLSCLSGSQASLRSLKVIKEGSGETNDPVNFEGSDFDLDDDLLDFDPSLGEVDVLGDFGLDDESAEPELGDFWIDAHDQWD